MKYKVIVTLGGIKAAASKLCRTKKEAEAVKIHLQKLISPPVKIEITRL